MPTAAVLNRPALLYTVMASDTSRGRGASRAMNRGAKMLRIPGPSLCDSAKDNDSKRSPGLAISAASCDSVSGETRSTVNIRNLLRDSHPADDDSVTCPGLSPDGISSEGVDTGMIVDVSSTSHLDGKCPNMLECEVQNASTSKPSSDFPTMSQVGGTTAKPPVVGYQNSDIVPVLKRKGSLKDKSRDSGARTVSVSEPPDTAPNSNVTKEQLKTSSVSLSTTSKDDDSKSKCDSSVTTTTVPKRRISFPADSVLTAVIQDGDTPELVRILTGRHGPGLVVPIKTGAGRSEGKRGVDVCQTNHVGLTALHHAVLANNLDAAKLLLCHGADVNAQDVHGLSPLHTAAACGSVPLTSLLVLFGADVFAQTLDQELPIDLAKELRVVRVLSAEMTRLVHRELWVASLLRARAEEVWLLVRKVLACVLLLVLHVCLCVRSSWKKHRKSD